MNFINEEKRAMMKDLYRDKNIQTLRWPFNLFANKQRKIILCIIFVKRIIVIMFEYNISKE